MISDVNLAYSEHARRYLKDTSCAPERTSVTGSPVTEVLRANLDKIEASDILSELGLEPKRYMLFTAHREENIDTKANFMSLFTAINALAEKYDKPVAVHMGLTASINAHLKYCHPLALDEVAADHPKTRFVMCHFGNPFLESAAAVVEKNPNVAADLSGLLEGRVDLDAYFREQAGYVFLLRTWLTAIQCWDKVMFGTDWPIVNLGEYIGFIRQLVPETHWEPVFFDNANRIYGLGL